MSVPEEIVAAVADRMTDNGRLCEGSLGKTKACSDCVNDVRDTLDALTPEQALAIAGAKGALTEDRAVWARPSGLRKERRYISPWEST